MLWVSVWGKINELLVWRMKSAYHYDNTRRMYFLSISSPAITAREPEQSGSIQMKNCNFISAGAAAAAKTYVECEKNEANLSSNGERLPFRNAGAHALTYSSQKADTQTHKKHKPKQSSRTASRPKWGKENNAALKRAIVCRARTLLHCKSIEFFHPNRFLSLDFHYISLCALEFPRLAGPFWSLCADRSVVGERASEPQIYLCSFLFISLHSFLGPLHWWSLSDSTFSSAINL